MICIFARVRGVVVLKVRMEGAARGNARRACILLIDSLNAIVIRSEKKTVSATAGLTCIDFGSGVKRVAKTSNGEGSALQAWRDQTVLSTANHWPAAFSHENSRTGIWKTQETCSNVSCMLAWNHPSMEVSHALVTVSTLRGPALLPHSETMLETGMPRRGRPIYITSRWDDEGSP